MSKKFYFFHFCVALCMVGAAMFSGCAPKKKPPVPEPQVKVEPPAPKPVIDTSDQVVFKPVDLDAEFQREVEANLQAIYFSYDRYDLSQESIRKLENAARFFNKYPNVRALIEGHCDERGSSEYNMGLGENRARVIKDYLSNYGIPSVRLEFTSWGKERPVTRGCVDEECHAQNRRAVYKILSK